MSIKTSRLGAFAVSLSLLMAVPAGAATTCTGSCNDDAEVTVDEIITMVNIALGVSEVSQCAAGDSDSSGGITVDEILTAVNLALVGCSDTGGALGRHRFELDPQGSTLKAVLAPNFEFTLGTFQGQTNDEPAPAFFELEAGVPDPNTGLAPVDVVAASDYIYASAQIAGITFCLKPIVPATTAGVVQCNGGLDFSIGTSIDHVVGKVGEDSFDMAACTAANGRVEGFTQVCAAGLVGGECFINSDCDSQTGSGDGQCGLATGVCGGSGFLSSGRSCNSSADCPDDVECQPVLCTAGKEGEECRNAGDCDTAPGADDGFCGREEAHPGSCNGPVSFAQTGGDSGAGAVVLAPLPELGLKGLPVQLSIEQALPCGDEGAVATQQFAMTTGLARTTIEHFSGGDENITFEQQGENLSCSDWATAGGGRFVLSFPTLHLNPMSGGDLIIGFTFQGK